jgi:23S rRNA (uracil1939-C5)-methyltransferase
MKLGDTLTCRIDALAYGGDGVARVGGRVLFVPDTAPGDTAEVRVAQLKKNFARGVCERLVDASADRAEPCCRLPDSDGGGLCRVPGCVYDHLSYAAEVRHKQRQLEGFLRHTLRASDATLEAPHASPSPLHYRNKIVLHAAQTRAGARLGYRLEPSHRVLDVPGCPLASEPVNAALAALRAAERHRSLPDGANATVRHTASDGALWWADGVRPERALPELLTEASPAGPLRVPREGFYQVNPEVADALVRAAAAWFAEGGAADEILDLYCGVGVFGFACLAAGGGRLTGVESGRAAVAAARLNAKSLGCAGARFECCALGREPLALQSLIDNARRATALVDPPREGLAPEVAQGLACVRPARILYVACDPATLTRDLALLTRLGGYRLTRARLFDMFPRTAHFETLAELCAE